MRCFKILALFIIVFLLVLINGCNGDNGSDGDARTTMEGGLRKECGNGVCEEGEEESCPGDCEQEVPADLETGNFIFLYSGDSVTFLELLPLAFKNSELNNPIFYKSREDLELINRFRNHFPDYYVKSIDEENIKNYLNKKIETSETVVLSTKDDKKSALLAALLASNLGYPLILEDYDYFDLSNKNCVEFSNTDGNCKTKQSINDDQATQFLISKYKEKNIEPNYIILVNENDPLSPAAVYLGAYRKGIPFFVSSLSTPTETTNFFKEKLLEFNINPKYLAIVGSHDYVMSDKHDPSVPKLCPQGEECEIKKSDWSIHYDLNYAQLDDDDYADVMYGRLVTLDLQDIFTQLNNIFFYDIVAKDIKNKISFFYCNDRRINNEINVYTINTDSSDCAWTAEKEVCAPKEEVCPDSGHRDERLSIIQSYLESNGFSVNKFLNNDMTKNNFINSFENDGIIFKGTHGLPFNTLLHDEYFSADEFPYMNPVTYITSSCFTTNYAGLKDYSKSFLLNFFRKGGIAYIGSSGFGWIKRGVFGFLTSNIEQSNFKLLDHAKKTNYPIEYFGDPAFNPNYPKLDSGINYDFEKKSENLYEIEVEFPLDSELYHDKALLSKGFFYYDNHGSKEIVKFEIDNYQTEIKEIQLINYEFDSSENPISEDCEIKSKDDYFKKEKNKDIENYLCSYFLDENSLQVMEIHESIFKPSSRGIYNCEIEKDIFEDKNYLVYSFGPVWVPLDIEYNNIAKLKRYKIKIETS